MVTPDEVARIAIFSALAVEERDRLSRAAADISLAQGEYAAAPGSDGALFGLLDGKIEAVQIVDGVERVVGERKPGDVFGEVPITLGTVFPVGFRAAEASRVFKLEPHDYHTVAAAAPQVGAAVGRLAANRIGGPGGLQGLAAEPPPPRAIVLGYRWDAACAELRHFLERNQITFQVGDTGCDASVGRPVAGAGRLAGGAVRRRQDGRPPAATAHRRAARTDDGGLVGRPTTR